MSTSKSCKLATSGVWLDPTGLPRSCCRIIYPIELLEEWKIIDVKKDLSKWFNNEFNQQFRKDLAAGQKRKECSTCWDLEDIGIQSERTAFSFSEEDNIPSIRILEIGAGRTCNLKCRMCDPYASSSISQELQKYQILKNDYSDPPLISDINIEDIKHIELIKVTGGEPFLHKPFETFLQNIVDNGLAQQTSIVIHTNATNFPNVKYLNPLSQFKNVQIRFSIDCVGNRNEYIRSNLVWNEMIDTIVSWGKWKQTCSNNIVFSVNSTTMILNIMYTESLLKFVNELRNNNIGLSDIKCNTYFLVNPDELAIKNFPDAIKLQLLEHLTRIDDDLFRSVHLHGITGKNDLKTMLSQTDSQVDTLATVALFFKEMRKLDRWRNQDLDTTFPELMQIFKDTGYYINNQ